MTTVDTVETLLRAFWAGDGSAVASLVTDDFQLINVAFPKLVLRGREALRIKVSQHHGGFPGPVENPHHEVRRCFVEGNFLMHERTDCWTYRGRTMQIDVAGLWEVHAGKVRLWKDYFDFGTYLRQMESVGEIIDVSKLLGL